MVNGERKDGEKHGGPGGRFEAGNQAALGNKGGGRPRFELIEECRKLTPAAVRVLQKALNGGGPQAIRAAEILLDRGYGKAAQLLEFQGEVGFRLQELDDAALEALIRERMRALGLDKPTKALPSGAREEPKEGGSLPIRLEDAPDL